MESHVDEGCPKQLSRRFFLGALGTAFGAAALAKVLPNVAQVQEPSAELVQVYTPKVHEAGSIVISLSSGTSLFHGTLPRDVRWAAQRSGRPVIGTVDGEVVAYHDPNA